MTYQEAHDRWLEAAQANKAVNAELVASFNADGLPDRDLILRWRAASTACEQAYEALIAAVPTNA